VVEKRNREASTSFLRNLTPTSIAMCSDISDELFIFFR
jgi:hypothetical protein